MAQRLPPLGCDNRDLGFDLFNLPDGRRRPTADADEKATLEGYLDFQRDTVLLKVDGVAESRLREVMTPTGLNMLGLVKHLAHAERYWFGFTFAGHDVLIATTDDEWRDLFVAAANESLDELVSRYRSDVEASNGILASSSLDQRAQRDDRYTLRWIILHMIEEIARHNGHLDIFRERIDGVTGE